MVTIALKAQVVPHRYHDQLAPTKTAWKSSISSRVIAHAAFPNTESACASSIRWPTYSNVAQGRPPKPPTGAYPMQSAGAADSSKFSIREGRAAALTKNRPRSNFQSHELQRG